MVVQFSALPGTFGKQRKAPSRRLKRGRSGLRSRQVTGSRLLCALSPNSVPNNSLVTHGNDPDRNLSQLLVEGEGEV